MPTTVITQTHSNHSQITIAILQDPRLNNSRKTLILFFADKLPDIAQFDSVTIQRSCRLAQPTVARTLRDLEDLGMVQRVVVRHPTQPNRPKFEYCLSSSYARQLLDIPIQPPPYVTPENITTIADL